MHAVAPARPNFWTAKAAGSRLALLAAIWWAPSAAVGQLLAAPAASSEGAAAESTTLNFRVGVIVNAKRGACRNILAIVAVPIECEEQSVKLLEEDFSKQIAAVKFRDLAGGAARQMLVSIPYLDSGDEARAVLTYEVTTSTTPALSPVEQQDLSIPERVPRNLRSYIGPSPFIEARHPKIRRLVKQLDSEFEEQAGTEGSSDWQKVEFLYDYVLDSIEYVEGDDSTAVATLNAESADCHGRSALFVALCRANKIPARMIWVHNHCYPEFYLERPDGEGVWLPAESAGVRAFGEMPLARTIMQKGDDFRMPEKPRERLRYATDFLIATPAVRGAGRPSVKYLREVVP